MYSLNHLDIRGYRQEPLPHTFFQQDEESQHAVMVFAGRGVNCQHPTLYYPTLELLQRGADVLLVDYCLRPGFSTFSDEEITGCVATDTIAAYQALFRHRSYQHVTLIGKSLGTAAMGYLLTTVSSMPQVQVIWLTPLLHRPELRAQIRQVHPLSLFIIGTEDFCYDASELAELEEVTKGATLVIKGAGHPLEVPDGTIASLHVMEQIMQAIQTFLDHEK